ncbi:oxidoreductase, aldo/keto reductase family protein [Leptospira broomii serovar Hurstbridge str. 5399]|uniref:Oxidoreductase, aldo/keto reductase family protein n=1 Tax=Leptospira broomii serovar Hurstbridge str. 5399 TaxID=1049789 RepID=T0F5X5_9LEPT|nr:aldo/keto reductase [Leptospira broomii]EQA43326.1 oxidoreductase, aldo/keto reductase family protein [Leptospira broomii serovar Hurstbridge str. 5399]
MQKIDPFISLYRRELFPGSIKPAGENLDSESEAFYFQFRGFRLSRVGFGCYRVGLGNPTHKKALILALRSGVNLIDTSANYGDGEAESLVGEVLSEEFAFGNLKRESVCIVTKAGYIQGRNMEVAEQKEASGNPFPETTYYQPGCFHCISPEFLEDQLDRSRKRLGLYTIDIFLLHNPEYFLMDRQKQGVPEKEAKNEYYRRIREAFSFLERARADGRILYYGISSNTFPDAEDSYTGTSLSKVLQISKEVGGDDSGFSVAQFPANWYEDGFLRNHNSAGENLLATCRNFDILPLVNRPLNSFISDKGMVRLAYQPGRDREALIAALESLFKELKTYETRIQDLLESQTGFQSLNSQWFAYREKIQNIEQLHQILGRSWIPAVQSSLKFISNHLGKSEAIRYTDLLNKTIPYFEEWILLHQTEARSSLYEELKGRFHSDRHGPSSLSSMMVLHLSQLLQKGTVLIGMRKEEYVKDILQLKDQVWSPISEEEWGYHGIRS